ncbi:hypothetical protein niasHT_022558 [Heterodera trifolii]|uniref:Uncharacterized protein n=1 Tax=Heterodera trifolii TaxID=157864 RepID=A0ABD2JR90_9BILA
MLFPSLAAFLFLPRLFLYASHIPSNRRSLPEYPLISCYSCASEEYELLFRRSSNVRLFGQPLLFDRLCDSKLDLASFGSTIPCDGNCVSVLEPQYFGGIQNERKPFTFVRGCSADVFAMATSSASSEDVPTELEYIQREHICMDLAIGQIWPELSTPNSKETVRVCSCETNACNTHETEADMANRADGRRYGRILVALAIITTLLFHL